MKKLLCTLLSIAIFSTLATAQQRLSALDLTRSSQSYNTPIIGKSTTGEEAYIVGDKCKDAVGVYPKSIIRINTKGFAYNISGKIGVADSKIDYSSSSTTSIPLSDGTRVFYHTIDGKKHFAGVENADRKQEKGFTSFRIVGDGKDLLAEKLMPGEKAKEFNVDIREIKQLELIVEDGGDGHWGDFAIWEDVNITYNIHQAVSLTTEVTDTGKGVTDADWQKLSEKMGQLPTLDHLAMQRSEKDWLIDDSQYKADVYAGVDGKSIIISNGLVARVFRVTPNLATIDIINQMDGNGMLRAVSSEGEVVIDGTTWHLGGLDGQPERGFLKEEWIDEMSVKNKSFVVADFEILDSISTLQWGRKRWALNKENPTGKSLIFTLNGVDEVQDLIVKLHYDIYDHIPVIRKWMEIINCGDVAHNLDSFKLERLFFSEPESPVAGDPSTFLRPNIHIESDFHTRSSFSEKESESVEHWIADPEYTSQTNYPLQTPCTMEAYCELGPDHSITKDSPFTSYKVYEMPMDSYDRERSGLFKRRFYTKIAPWTTENPIFMHLTSTNPEIMKRAVDQCEECGYEMIILSFGSGLNMEDISEENIAKYKELVDYAHSKGIEMGCYSLLASRWIGDDVDCINPKTGQRGGMTYGSAPCLCSDWGEEYLHKIKTFMQRTGMTCFEHDGSYAGDVCASTTHTHHKGLNDSQWKQFQRITELYNWMCAEGIYTNVPDFYLLNGTTKVGIGYREVNWSLPRDRQIIHTRQLNYKCTWERVGSSLWSFVPLTQYHGGGAAATLEPLKDHLYEYRTLMFQNYGAGIQACYRGPRLYDTEETKQVVKEVIGWYKKYREILNSDIIHLRQPDARDWDGIMHINPELKEKALAMIFNPCEKDITRTIKLPLYYTGLEKKAYIRERESKAKVYRLNRDYTVEITVTIPAKGYTWFVVE